MVRFEPAPDRRSILGHLYWFLSWVFVVVVALWLRPSHFGHGTHQQLGLPPCPSVLLYGRPCPGCGLTTSFTHLAHGNFAMAFQTHPLGPLLFLAWGVTALMCLYGFVRKKRFITDTPGFNRGLVATAWVFFLFGAVRFAAIDYRSENPVAWLHQVTSR